MNTHTGVPLTRQEQLSVGGERMGGHVLESDEVVRRADLAPVTHGARERSGAVELSCRAEGEYVRVYLPRARERAYHGLHCSHSACSSGTRLSNPKESPRFGARPSRQPAQCVRAVFLPKHAIIRSKHRAPCVNFITNGLVTLSDT